MPAVRRLLRVANPARRDTSITPGEPHVRLIGEAALVNGQARLQVGEEWFALRFTDVWSRARGRWQLVAWQSTRLPAPPGR